MLRLTSLSTNPAPPGAPRLALAYHDRVKSRLAALLPDGRAVAITLPRGSVMRGGAVLAGDEDACLVVDAVADDDDDDDGTTTVVQQAPENCQQTISNGQPYVNCGGVWYQPVMSGAQTTYQQVAAPPQ